MALDDSTLAHFRDLLTLERAELMDSLERMGASPSRDGEYDPNFADISQVTAEKGEAEALAQPLRETRAEIDAALERIEKGSYGFCARCGADIPLERLEALPKSKYCTPCASVYR